MSSITATTKRESAESKPTVPFNATLASEWTKLVTMRSAWITLTLAATMSIGITALFAWVTGWTWDDLSLADQANFNPIEVSFVGAAFSGILLAMLGISIVISEYDSGMMRLTMTVTPDRGRIVRAKALIIAALAIVAGLAISVANFQVAQAIFGAHDLPTSSLGDADAFRAIVVGTVVTGAVFPLIGTALAFIFRSSVLAITTVMALIYAPPALGGLLPRRWQEDVLAWLPGQATDSFAIGHLYPDDPMFLGATTGLFAAAVWTIGSLVVATIVLKRRDV